MSELRLVAEIVLRTAVLAAVAEIVQRLFVRDGRAMRRLWLGTGVAIVIVTLAAVGDLRPQLPRAVPVVRLNAARGEVASAPWTGPQFRRRPRVMVTVRTVYVAGATAVLLFVGANLVALRRLRRGAIVASARIAGDANVYLASVPAPCTLGVWRPAILLPHAAEHWPEAKLRAALAHEMAHVRQRDALGLLVAWLGCAALWFAPAAWWVRHRWRAACECASDDAAARAVRGRVAYARMLVEIAESALEQRMHLASSMASGRSIESRVGRLVGGRRTAPRVAALLVLPLLLAAFDWQRDFRSIPAAQALLVDLDSASADKRAEAIDRLARWRGRERDVLPLLIARLGDEAPVRALPRWNYDRDGWCPARHTLVRPAVGEVAAIGLASLSTVAAPALAERLGDPNPVVRRNAAWALGELRHPRGVGRAERLALMAALADSDPRVRAAAAWSLGDLGERDATDALRAMLRAETDAAARAEGTAALRAVERGLSLEAFRHPD